MLTLTLPEDAAGTLALDAREEVAWPEMAKAGLPEMKYYALPAGGEVRLALHFT